MIKQLAKRASGVQQVGHRISGSKSQPLMRERLVAAHPVSKDTGRRNSGWHPPKSGFRGTLQAGFVTDTGWLCLAGLILLLTATGTLTAVLSDPTLQPTLQPKPPDDS